MPKRADLKRVEAHLTPDEHLQFVAHAKEKDWSAKKLAENIIRDYLKELKKKPTSKR
jgi:hypothetical protein